MSSPQANLSVFIRSGVLRRMMFQRDYQAHAPTQGRGQGQATWTPTKPLQTVAHQQRPITATPHYRDAPLPRRPIIVGTGLAPVRKTAAYLCQACHVPPPARTGASPVPTILPDG